MGRKSKISFEEKISAVEDYLNGIKSVTQIADALSVSKSAVEQWINKYRVEGKSGLQTTSKNMCYPDEIKIQAVEEFLSGKASQREICNKYEISAHGVLQNWIKRYNGYEVIRKKHSHKGDRLMTKGRKTTFDERVEIVSFCIKNRDDYQLAAEKYQVSYQQVYTWAKKYKEDGVEALADRRGKRKDLKNMTENEKLAAKVKLLEAQNKELQLEVGFLKKLKEVERRRTGKISTQPSKSTTEKPDSK